MKVVCPKCGHDVKLRHQRDPEKEPVVLCPKCRSAFFPEKMVAEEVETAEPDRTPLIPSSDRYRDRQRQAKRYLVLMMLLLVVFVLYQWVAGLSSVSPWKEARDTAARGILKDLAAAQESYYTESDQYTEDLAVLAPYYLDRAGVTVEIIHADKQAWAAKAYHEKSDHYFLYDSRTGGFHPGRVPKSQDAEKQEKTTTD